MSSGAGSETDPEPDAAASRSMTPEPKRARRIARRSLAILLIIVGCFLSPVAIASLWVHHTVIDPQGYVDTVAPLSGRPAIQQGLAERAADAVTDLVDVDRFTDELPPTVARRVEPIVEQSLHSLAEDLALRIVESDQFQEVWRRVNERAHGQVVKLLTGTGVVEIEGDEVVLDLKPLVQREVQQLRELGIPGVTGERLEQIDARFVLIDSPVPAAVQSILRFLDHLAYVLPFVVLALFAAAVWAFPNHRRGVMWVGIALALTMSLHVAAVGIGRRVYLDVISGTSVNEEAAGDVYTALTSYLRDIFVGVLVLSLLVAAGAVLAGRNQIRRLSTQLRPLARHVAAHERGVQIAVVITGFLVFVLLREPSWFSFLLVVALVVAALVAIRVVTRTNRDETTDEPVSTAPSE